MIIVSQDKEIINFIADFSEDGDGFGIGADTNSAESQCWDLGYYKTEKRAQEVLREIAKAKAFFEEIKVVDDTFLKRKLLGMRIYKDFDTYEMPKE